MLSRLASEYGVELTYYDEVSNNSYVCGNEIVIGKYRDKEKELISFFHELGHIFISNDFKKKWKYNTLMIEIECWNLGIEEARKKGILFSDRAIQWGYKRALTYVGHDEREWSNWMENYGKNLWVNRNKRYE